MHQSLFNRRVSFYLQGVDLTQTDYDGRSVLHIAAAEGYDDIVRFVLKNSLATANIEDRWGRKPIDDARQFKHESVLQILTDAMTAPKN